ncbi:MAG: hypothetical protein ACYC3I_26260 [Gemmataceae bacterium]
MLVDLVPSHAEILQLFNLLITAHYCVSSFLRGLLVLVQLFLRALEDEASPLSSPAQHFNGQLKPSDVVAQFGACLGFFPFDSRIVQIGRSVEYLRGFRLLLWRQFNDDSRELIVCLDAIIVTIFVTNEFFGHG